MPTITAVVHLSLDGVMQAPGRADEDPRGGFEHGGWAMAGNDPELAKAMGEGMSGGASLLFGRRTYEDFFKVWPGRKDNPFSAILDNSQKYVASKTLREPLPWKNSALLPGEAAESVGRLKRQPGQDIVVLGSGELLQSLMRQRLVDTFMLTIHPVLLGRGRRLFNNDEADRRCPLRLARSVTTTTGVVVATYVQA